MAKPKQKLTAAQRRAKRERKKNYEMTFINGKQKWVRREPTIEGLSVEEFVARNANPIWLHEYELWELMVTDVSDDALRSHIAQVEELMEILGIPPESESYGHGCITNEAIGSCDDFPNFSLDEEQLEAPTTNKRLAMTRAVHGRVHGKIIELDEDLGVAEGQEVEIQVTIVQAT